MFSNAIRLAHALPLLLALAAATPAAPQSRGGHTVHGDFKVDEGRPGDAKGSLFSVVLYDTMGRVVSRQTVSGGGRYTFSGVRNGEYDLVVEFQNEEVARTRIVVSSTMQTDFRHDLALEWKPPPGARGEGRAATVSADAYPREGDNRARFEKAVGAVTRKEYAEAAALLGRLVADDPKDYEARTELGTVYFLQGRLAESEKLYVAALAERPAYAPALVNLGKLRFGRKDYDGAVEALARAVERSPQSADANYFLGESYLQIKKGSKAVGYLNEAARLGRTEAHLRLALLYDRAGLKGRAAAEYEQFLAKEPNHPDGDKFRRYVAENKEK